MYLYTVIPLCRPVDRPIPFKEDPKLLTRISGEYTCVVAPTSLCPLLVALYEVRPTQAKRKLTDAQSLFEMRRLPSCNTPSRSPRSSHSTTNKFSA